MSDKPRIFVSAVSSEFGPTRQDVANILTRLGYEPVLQDVFGTEPGDLRQMLRDKIDACDGLIQIVGQAYGFEPPAPDKEFGRVSYTQFEYLYARTKGKKTWLILTPPDFAANSTSTPFDLPRQPDHPNPEAYRAERRALQEAYRERLRKGSDVWYDAADKTELALKVERLRDDLAKLRQAFRSWQRAVTRYLVAAILLLTVLGGGVSWMIIRLHKDDPVAKALAALSPDLIRTQLEKSIREAYDRDAAEAGKIHDWKVRQKALRDAAEARDQKRTQLDGFLGSIQGTIASGQASPEFLELSRILQEQGVNAALDYLSNQESSLLERANQLAAIRQQEVRRTLAPLLKGVSLHQDRGDLAEADALCEKLLAADADWPEALDQHFWVLLARGYRAFRYESLAVARQRFESALATAERLVKIDPASSAWQRNRATAFRSLGDVSKESGQLGAAREFYQRELDIAKKRAAADPADSQAQRDLSDAYINLGYVSQRANGSSAARDFYRQSLEICKKRAAANPADTGAQRSLSISYEMLGDATHQAGSLDEARQLYQKSFEIRKKLAAGSTDSNTQRNLAVAYWKLGLVDQDAGRLEDALNDFQQDLDMTKKLAVADPANAVTQRDLAMAYSHLGYVNQQLGRLDTARDFYVRGFDIDKKLAAADPANAEAQRNLSTSYSWLGDAELQANRPDAACAFYQQGLEICTKLAAGDPANAQVQGDLVLFDERLGDANMRAGRSDAARKFYEQAVVVAGKLAAADPANAEVQYDLLLALSRLGPLLEASGDFEAAIRLYERAVAVIQRMLDNGQHTASSKSLPLALRIRLARCRQSGIAAGPWDKLLKQPAEKQPALLKLRIEWMTRRRQIDQVAQAAAALAKLEPKTPANLYDAACGYGQCAKLAAGWPGQGPFPPPTALANAKAADQKSQQKYIRAALDLLQAAVKAGYHGTGWMQNTDLAALRDLPEFKKLLTARAPAGH